MNSNNPFVGLRSFELTESLVFFGRQDQIMELLKRLHRFRFVAVIGPSGCGKSSLIRAGLIPALKAGYLLNDQDVWRIFTIKPGESPLHNLSNIIHSELKTDPQPEQIDELAKNMLSQGPDALMNFLQPYAGEQTNFLLLVDQFEELFRFSDLRAGSDRKEEATEFINLLLYLAQQKDIPIYVVITMRSDFIGDCDAFFGLPEAINQGLYLVPRLNRVQIKQAIEGPLKLYGISIAPMLTSRMLNDVQGTRDELPILQHALMRICDRRAHSGSESPLDLADYQTAGGLEGALSRHAYEAIDGLSKEDLALVQRAFQALTAVDSNGRKIRRPAHLSQIVAFTGATKEKIEPLLDRFIAGNSSLLVKTLEKPDDPIIDISHESLIRQWQLLGEWVDDERDNSLQLLHLVESARSYRQKSKDLLTGSELSALLTWVQDCKPTLTWASRYTTEAKQAFEYLHRSKLKDRSRKFAFRAVGVALTLSIVAVFLIAVFIRESQQTGIRSQVFLARSNKSFYEQNYLEAFLYAVEANDLHSSDSVLIRCTKCFPAYSLHSILHHPDEIDSAKFDVNPAIIDVYVDNVQYRWNIPNDSLLSKRKVASSADPDENMHSGEIDRLLSLWDVDPQGKVKIFDRSDGLRTADTIRYPRNLGIIYRISFSHDRKLILTSGVLQDSLFGATVWDAAKGSRIGSSLVHAREIYGGIFSKDDQRIITYGQDSTARLWQLSPDIVLHQPDKDLPSDLLKLQAEVITGAFVNDTTSEVNYLTYDQWKTRKTQWLQEAAEHYKECRYHSSNYWGLVYQR